MARPGPLTDYTISQRWKIGKRIGGGSFGEVYVGKNMKTGEMVAIKAESVRARFPQLIYEARLLKYLQGGDGVCKVYHCCTEHDYHLMVMELLGASLEDVFVAHNRHFTLETICDIGLQLLHRVEYLHTKSFIHRDIKPDNFLIGQGALKSKVHMIDMGLAKKYRDPRTGTHIPYRDNKNLTGTARYASINAHLGVEQSRRDDLESIGYVLLYFLRNGLLPWQGIQAENKQEKYQRIMEKKMCLPVDVLCRNLPGEFAVYLYYCRALRFEDQPDYQYLRGQFKRLIDKKISPGVELKLDWADDPEDPNRQAALNIPMITDAPTREQSRRADGEPDERLLRSGTNNDDSRRRPGTDDIMDDRPANRRMSFVQEGGNKSFPASRDVSASPNRLGVSASPVPQGSTQTLNQQPSMTHRQQSTLRSNGGGHPMVTLKNGVAVDEDGVPIKTQKPSFFSSFGRMCGCGKGDDEAELQIQRQAYMQQVNEQKRQEALKREEQRKQRENFERTIAMQAQQAQQAQALAAVSANAPGLDPHAPEKLNGLQKSQTLAQQKTMGSRRTNNQPADILP